jgi:hypothetical protein
LGVYTGLVTIQVVEDRLLLDMNGDVYSLDMFKKDHYFGQKQESGPMISVIVRVDGDHLLLYSKKLNKTLTCIPVDDQRFASELGLWSFQ